MPGLSGAGARDPWAASFGQLACYELERCLGAYLVDDSAFWTPPDYWDADDLAVEMTDAPNIWTDGSREDFSSTGGFEVAVQMFMCLPLSLRLRVLSGVWRRSMVTLVWKVAVLFCLSLGHCRLLSVLNFGGAIVALQSYWPCHLGIDNLNVARSIGRLLDDGCSPKPLPLFKDGDLIAIAQYMIRARGRDTVRVFRVKGHATDDDVEQGRVWLEDKLGDAEADAAADLGGRHQSELLVGARCVLLSARNWYPIMLQLHRFMIAIAGVTVNHNGKGILSLICSSGIRE